MMKILQTVDVPLYPSVHAGDLYEMFDDYFETVSVPESYTQNRRVFAMKVYGDSMIGASIYPDDMVIVDATERPIEAAIGKVVIATIDGKATIKRLRITDDGYALQPENAKYKTRYIQDGEDFNVLGIVFSVSREIE